MSMAVDAGGFTEAYPIKLSAMDIQQEEMGGRKVSACCRVYPSDFNLRHQGGVVSFRQFFIY